RKSHLRPAAQPYLESIQLFRYRLLDLSGFESPNKKVRTTNNASIKANPPAARKPPLSPFARVGQRGPRWPEVRTDPPPATLLGEGAFADLFGKPPALKITSAKLDIAPGGKSH